MKKADLELLLKNKGFDKKEVAKALNLVEDVLITVSESDGEYKSTLSVVADLVRTIETREGYLEEVK